MKLIIPSRLTVCGHALAGRPIAKMLHGAIIVRLTIRTVGGTTAKLHSFFLDANSM